MTPPEGNVTDTQPVESSTTGGWRVVVATDAGSRHKAMNAPCADAAWADVLPNADGSDSLVMCVADGAGSAKFGDVGATECVSAAVAFMRGFLLEPDADVDALPVNLIATIKSHLRGIADPSGMPLSAYACTFQLVVASDALTFVLQVGDGAVVVDVGNGLELMPQPAGGEFINQTHFVTDDDPAKFMVVNAHPGKATRVASLTDGLTRLAVNFAVNKPHEPFFTPLFGTLASSKGERSALEAALKQFLASGPIEARTDDDKTLALATRVP